MLFFLVLNNAVFTTEEWKTIINNTNDEENPFDYDCILNTNMPLLYPSDINSVGAHLCRLGRASHNHDSVCINPFHLIYTTQQVNIDQNRCAYGSRNLCPHGNCVWTWPNNGEPKYCLTFGDPITNCSCTRTCGHYPRF
jgi:hypothetical protein